MTDSPDRAGLSPQTAAFYRRMLRALRQADVSYLVGGAYAFSCYTGITRHTKDLDLFVRPADLDRTLAVLDEAGCRTAIPYPHWLAKAYAGEDSIDVIFHSGNGVSEVDGSWFAPARAHEVLDVPVKLCPPEEIIWSKAYIMERERYDGADVAHLLHCCAERLDWERLIERFDAHWRLLLSHLILFGFIYPAERTRIPSAVMKELLRRLHQEEQEAVPDERLCRGTLLSRAQYLVDVEQWDYRDARLRPHGRMTPEEVAHWTSAIDDEDRP